MIKNFILLTFILLISPFSNSYAEIQKGKWEFVKDTDYCFIQSAPIKTEIPKDKIRGKNYILVYRMNKSFESIIQITAGFNFQSSESIDVKIDDLNYNFYADEDTAWTNDDKKVITAMKKGLELVVTGISNKETKVIDTYTLRGFTVALNKLSTDC